MELLGRKKAYVVPHKHGHGEWIDPKYLKFWKGGTSYR